MPKSKARRGGSQRRCRSPPELESGWECTVCTYRNRAESFRCEMCDVRKGTSTRKPRLNPTVVEQQQSVQKFVQQQQQAMIAHAHKERSRDRNSLCNSSSLHDADSPGPSTRSLESPFSCSGSSRAAANEHGIQSPLPADDDVDCDDDVCSPSPASRLPTPCLSPAEASQMPTAATSVDHVADLGSPPLLSPGPSYGETGGTAQALDKASPTTEAPSIEHAAKDSPTALPTPTESPRSCAPVSTVVGGGATRGRKKGSVNSFSRKPPRTFFRRYVDERSARSLEVTVRGVTVLFTDYKLLCDPPPATTQLASTSPNLVSTEQTTTSGN